jgi:hypothetical protein
MEERKENQQNKQKQDSQSEELRHSGGHQNASANQGGTTDMDNEALIAGRTTATERGSGASTKRNVTGSDYDGQVST